MREENDIFHNKIFRQVIDTLPTAIFTTDPNGKLNYYNSAAVELSGREPELGSDNWFLDWDLFYPDGSPMPHEKCPMVIALKEGRSINGAEGIIERPDGERFCFEAYPSPLMDDTGTIYGGINMLLNISERKKVQRELEALNKNLEERVNERTQSLLSYQSQLRSLAFQLNRAEEEQRHKIASELHNNLGQLLSVGKMKVDMIKRENSAHQIKTDIEELKKILDDALFYTRNLMSDLRPPSSIDEEMEASIGWVAEKFKKHGLQISIEDDGRPKPLKEEIQEVVVQSVRELLYNIVKHTSEKKAFIDLQRDGGLMKVTVRDEGKGFEVEEWKSGRVKNGGFGLFNIQERIDLLGGRVNVESKPGKGTKVTLFIPLDLKETTEKTKPAEEFDQAVQTGHTKNGPQKIKVLFADDHDMVRKGIRNIIEEQKNIIVVGEASDGIEAVKLTKQTSPDIVLMDVSMPRMDGIKATKKITSKYPEIRVVGLSFHEEEGVAKKMRNAGASAFLTKSDAFESLVETIRAEASILQKRR